MSGIKLLEIARKCERTIQAVAELAKSEYGTDIPIKIDQIVPSNIANAIISKYSNVKKVVEKRPRVTPRDEKSEPTFTIQNKKPASNARVKQKYGNRALEDAHKEKCILDGIILEPYKKGRDTIGIFVEVLGCKGLMYTSEISDTVDLHKGAHIKAVIYKYTVVKNKTIILVSNLKAVNMASRDIKRNQQLKEVKKGMRYDGIIEKIYDNAILVRIDELVGIVSRKEAYWGRSRLRLDEIFQEGQKMEVEVTEPLSYDENGKTRITLSHRVCIPNYWYDEELYAIGNICKGTIIDIVENGIIVELHPGFEGYVHVSELSHSLLNILNKLSYQKLADISESISFRIIDKEPDDNRLLLSVLQSNDNWLDKWEHIHENYQVENIYNAVVVAIEEERIWVSLNDGLEASINRSEFVWHKVYQINDAFHIFDNVNIMVLGIDKDKKRITASIKKCEPNPWEIAEENVSPGDILAFRIIEKRPNGYRVYACDNQNLIGTLPSSEVSWLLEDKELDPNLKYKAKVLELNAKICSLKVSLKRLTPNPWELIVVGGIIQGTIDSNERGKLFINLSNGLVGYTDEINLSSIKSSIEFKIIAFDAHSKEIRLSHKRIKFDMEMDTVVKDFFNHTSI